jgi:glucans biosynthesis protein
VPSQPAKAGASFRYRYRLHWLAQEPYPAGNIGFVTATRIGRGGKPGHPRPKGVTKFIIDFAGRPIESLAQGARESKDAKPVAAITASRGEISYVFVEPIPSTKNWRAHFDLAAQGPEPVELRVFLRLGDRPLTETWLYQFEPRA